VGRKFGVFRFGINGREVAGTFLGAAFLSDEIVNLKSAPEATSGGFDFGALEEIGIEIEIECAVVKACVFGANVDVFFPAGIVGNELTEGGGIGFGEYEFGLNENGGVLGDVGEFDGLGDGVFGLAVGDHGAETALAGGHFVIVAPGVGFEVFEEVEGGCDFGWVFGAEVEVAKEESDAGGV